MRAGGAMPLLISGVDPWKARIQCQWWSNTMWCYIHEQARPLFQGLSSAMVGGGRQLSPLLSQLIAELTGTNPNSPYDGALGAAL
ncbi:hypothetical protein ACHAWF_003142 [Thalassiosira exigua]